MGNSKSKKIQKEPDRFFEREKMKEIKRQGKNKMRNVNVALKRVGVKEPALPPVATPPAPPKSVAPAPAHVRSYDDEALDRMRYQLQNDTDAFLMNNILLSVQFFENYESLRSVEERPSSISLQDKKEVHHIKNNPISEREQQMDAAMVRRHKHVFFADRLQECVHEHVTYQRRRGQVEPLAAPRLFVIYDNVEASEPGDTSDYSAVLDAPFYKLLIEDCKEPGYVKLKKLEVLESAFFKENDMKPEKTSLDDSVYTDSEKESNASDDASYLGKGEELLQKLESKLIKSHVSNDGYIKNKQIQINSHRDVSGRRGSGPIKQVSLQAAKSNISNINIFQKTNSALPEETLSGNKEIEDETRPRKSILKNSRRTSVPLKEIKNKTPLSAMKKMVADNSIGEDTETSGYRSTTSSRQNESSETESDYGYSTITECTTPKKLELSESSMNTATSGVLPEECWTTVKVRAFDNWSDDDEDDTSYKMSLSKNLYETYYYLDSTNFMNNFVDNFIINLGNGLGLSEEAINGALTQGASIYCDTVKNGIKIGTEVFPALIAAWPNTANQWIIRERKIIQNPRTNFSYQWPTKYMVNKAIGFGCLLVPVGFRPKRGVNPEQVLQWKVIFPAAERYLESCLAHSHMRCYLFALALQRTFLDNETSKIGIDVSHIKNHLFWQCEDNYAKWPEDRLGETLRLFLKSFYVHFGQGRFPNYFIETCNDFKSIPKPLLLKQQRRLRDILESPVMHLLSALDKLKYNKKDFYPTFNSIRLYDILTCKNPLRMINPNLPEFHIPKNVVESDSDDNDTSKSVFDKAKDKQYQWKKERQRQIQERRKAQLYYKKQKPASAQEREINTKIILPAKMEAERRRLVLDFFVSHFIAMARSSERFDAIKQAVIYLEQAQRLSKLLMEEPGGDMSAHDYLDVIRDQLTDCQRKLVNQGGFKLPPRKESQQMDRIVHKPLRKIRPKYQHIVSQESPIDTPGASAFTFVDVHVGNLRHEISDGEDSKL